MTKPISAFTVTVQFKNIYYDVEITPTLNGKPIENLPPERLAQWNGAEQSHKIYSRKILEMLDSSDIPDDYLTAKGSLTLGSAEHFTFNDKSVVNHNDGVKKVWDDFIRYLQEPDSGIDELGSDDEAVSATGPGAGLKISPNVYLNLGPVEQKAVRLSLFQKKCQEYFAGVNGLPIAADLYTENEKSCLEFVLYRNPTRPKMPPGKEANTIWFAQSKQERTEMAPHVRRIREEMEQEALRVKQAEADRLGYVPSDEEEEIYI